MKTSSIPMIAVVKYVSVALGLSLFVVNLFGLTQSLRPAEFKAEHLRFGETDISLSLSEYQAAIKRQPEETELQYSERLTKVIAKGTAHIHWERYDPGKFNQRVPLWENWILFLMGKFSGIPEFERYHFVSVDKSIERGIGICGEVSMLMTSLLEKNGIQADIVTFPGHVVVQAQIDGETKIFDPDFGVVLPYSFDNVSSNIESASQKYVDAGYTQSDKVFFEQAFASPLKVWGGPEDFIAKKYYFEKASYHLKWLVPIMLVLTPLFIRKKHV